MRKPRLTQRPEVNATTGGPKGKFLGKFGSLLRRRSMIAILASVCVVSLFSLPLSAPTDIDDIVAAIEQVFTDAFNALLGNEFEPQTIRFAYKPPLVDSVHVDITVLGFAFCNPPDPWAAPDPNPTFPYNVYGCINDATVTANVSPDVTSADILMEVDDCFIDIEYERDETPACLNGAVPECCPTFPPCIPIDPCTTVPGEGYLLTSGSVAATLTLTRVGTCLNASIVPGSVVVTLTPKSQGFRKTPSLASDTCVEDAWGLFSPLFFDLLNETASEGIEELLVSQIDVINQALCPLTPVEESTWGHIKALFD